MECKYLIYSSEISEDIFNQIIRKIESQGLKPDLGGINNDYYGFKKYRALLLDFTEMQWLTVVHIRRNLSSFYVSVSDILGSCPIQNEVNCIIINVPKL